MLYWPMQPSIGWNTHSPTSRCWSNSVFRASVCNSSHFPKLQISDNKMFLNALQWRRERTKHTQLAESNWDLSQRDPWFHVFKTGLIFDSAVWGEMDKVRPQCPPGKVQSHYSLQNQSPLTDWHRACDGGRKFVPWCTGILWKKCLLVGVMHQYCSGRIAGSPTWAQSDGRRVSPSRLWEQNLQLLWHCREKHQFIQDESQLLSWV